MPNPAVSVILPAYNAEDFIEEAVDSVRAQSFDDLELITVDDGSTDRTGEMLDRLAADWPAMTVIHQPNQGLAAARNNAIARARADWFALLDADDLWTPEKLSRCMSYLADHPDLSIVYTPMAPVTTAGVPMQGHSKPCHAGWLAEKLFQSIFVHDPAAVFHRRVIETCGGFDESLPVSVGNEFWLRVSPHFAFGLIDEPLAIRRWSETSLTRRSRVRGRVLKVRVHERFYFEQGGCDVVPRRAAMRRLAQLNYKAGKALLAAGQPGEAAGHLRKALGYCPCLLKAWPYAAAATLRAAVTRKAESSA